MEPAFSLPPKSKKPDPLLQFPVPAMSELDRAIAAGDLTVFESVRHVSALEYFAGDTFAIDAFHAKYAHPVSMYFGPWGAYPLPDVTADDTRRETPAEAMFRVHHALAQMEPTAAQAAAMTAIWFHMEWNRMMVPGGRPAYGVGTLPAPDGQHKISLINCTTVGQLEDNLESIYKAGYQVGKVQSRGEGVGVEITPLRPKGMKTNNAAKSTSGATHWSEIFDWSTGAISQNGRRGALLISIEDHHPEAYSEFITVKSGMGKLLNANISIKLGAEFMAAYEADEEFQLWWADDEGRKHLFDKVNAREYMRKISANACDFAEPGVLFWSTAQAYSNSDHLGDPRWNIVGVNACSEQALPHLDSCTLAHTNWATLPRDRQAAILEARSRAKYVHHLVDNVVELQIRQDRSALPEQVACSVNLRRVGAGFTGVADWLIRMGVPYDSEEAIELVDALSRAHCEGAYRSSVALGKERGAFPANNPGIKDSLFMKHILAEGIIDEADVPFLRNVCCVTIAPVGTGSLKLQNYGSGIEPGFGSYRYRRTRASGEYKWYFIVDPFVKKNCLELTGDAWPFTEAQESDVACEQEIITWLDARVPQALVRPVKYIDPMLKVRLIAAVQRWIDSSISVTFNLVDSTPEEIEQIYVECHRQKLKGCSVYVYNDKNREPIIQWTRPVTFNFAPKAVAAPAYRATEMNEVERARLAETKRPDRLHAEIVTRKSEGKKWYFSLSKHPETHKLAELFINTSDEKEGHTVAKSVLTSLEKLMAEQGIPDEVLTTQKAKAKGDRDYLKLSRLVSISLRWNIPVADIVTAIRAGAGDLVVGSLLFHIVHLLEEHCVSPAGYSRSCGACGSEDLVFEAGCFTCANCASSKCG